jgi:polyisoprenoid-binding protein YceI
MLDTTQRDAKPQARRRWLMAISVLVFAAGLVGAGLLWFFAGEAPAEVDLGATASAVSEGDDSAVAANQTGIEGAWVVDTSVGSFVVDDETTATFAGFRVEEVLNSIGSTTAVGRSPEVAGTIIIEGTTLTSGSVNVDLTAIVSDEARREDSIQDALNTASEPEASFVLTEPIELGDAAATGDLVSVSADGELTINGVTNQVRIDLEAQLVDGLILVTGSTDLVFADYGVTVPSAPVVVSVEDQGVLEFQLWLSN